MKKILAKIFFPFAFCLKKLADLWYDFTVLLHSKFKRKGEKKFGRNRDKIRNLVFYSSLVAIPLAFFILSEFVINGNSILLAFQKYEGRRPSFAGFDNFKRLINEFLDPKTGFMDMLKRSLLVYVISNTIGTVLPIIFTYYVYKKLFMHNIFKVILFIPSVLSSIVTVSIFKMTANEVLPQIYKMLTGEVLDPLLSNPNTTFKTLLIYTVWMGLGGSLLTQLAAMNTVDPSVTESAQLEGISFYQELWHIVLPACYQVLTLGFVTGIALIFTNNMNLYAFYGTGAPGNASLIGYYFQVETLSAEWIDYPYLAAWGLIVTIIVTPLTLISRHLINKYGPTEESNENKKKRA